MILFVILATLSGVPALVYQVAWTREVGLLAGSQIEGISAVLAVFFGGLALGSRIFGGLADRSRSALRLYGWLEIAAGGLALFSSPLLRALGSGPLAGASPLLMLGASSAILLPVTLLLGGTLPALLRAATSDPTRAARIAGVLVACNTAGAVAGVLLGALSIPWLGLRLTLTGAGLTGISIGLASLLAARFLDPREPVPAREESRTGVAAFWLLAAATAGVATLAFEVLATRAATLRLGSSLYAWALTLGLFLVGLALGNLLLARRAGSTRDPAADLGWLELAAALSLVGAASWGVPSISSPASGVSARSLLSIAAWILPPTVLMGAAFPLFVRGALGGRPVGAAFGALSAANTGGGIAGSLLAPFVLLPTLGLEGALLACAAISALLAASLVLCSELSTSTRRVRALAVLAACSLAGAAVIRPEHAERFRQVIFVSHGRQASAAVLHVGGRRDLLVDGDPEASTFGNARTTEELLASVPLLLHPDPRRFLEVGLGSGITLGTATRFELERIECVEIADAVLEAARFFAPDNRDVAAGRDPRVRITRGDGRAYLARQKDAYDVIVANTVHPWSVGSTGLYSLEYFRRIQAALRSGGVAAQWLPVRGMHAEDLSTILRTFFHVFEHGAAFWGADSLIVVGSKSPLESLGEWPANAPRELLEGLGLDSPRRLESRFVAGAEAVRKTLGPGTLLSDDRPVLETRSALRRSRGESESSLEVVLRMARLGAETRPSARLLALWLESREARALGQAARARSLLDLAERGGLSLAREDRLDEQAGRAFDDLHAGHLDEAVRQFRSLLAEAPGSRRAGFGLGLAQLQGNDPAAAARALERLVAAHPSDAESWNLLASAYLQLGQRAPAGRALKRALEADPFFPQALANSGLLAIESGDAATGREMQRRLREISPLGSSEYEQTLDAALDRLR